ncbi:MAG: hypothetical protein JKX91_06465 [Rhizobiaceae bacterium]|nr:hypothetical protein [Rhizobiaceae bacterium]
MAIDPSIILQGRVPDLGAAVQQGFSVGQQFRQAPIQNQLLQQQVTAGEQSQQINQQAIQAERLKQVAFGANVAISAFKKGDMSGVLGAIRDTFPDEQEQAKEIEEFQDNPEAYISQAQDIVTAVGARQGKQGLASAKTEIFDNGTTLKVLPDGTTEVTNPAGDVVTGKEREKVLTTARQEQIDFAGKQAASKAGGALDPKVSDLAADKQAKLSFQKSKSKFNDTISSTVSAIGSAKATNTIMTDTANEIKSFISGLNAVYGASLSGIPGSEAKRLKGLIITMKANSAFGTLIDLKASGGTLGAISSSELELLAAKLGNLDQSGDIPEMIRVLDQILEQNTSSITRMETAFASEKDRFSRGFGEEAPQQVQQQPAPHPQTQAVAPTQDTGITAEQFRLMTPSQRAATLREIQAQRQGQ